MAGNTNESYVGAYYDSVNGYAVDGVPVVDGDGVFVGDIQPTRYANKYYVDTTNGSDSNTGLSKSSRLKTIQAAINLATTANGDVIYVYPGTYAENLTCAKANVSLVALARKGNSKRVAVAPATGIALTLNQTLRFVAEGIRFVGTSAVGVLSDGEASLFVDCDFTSDTSHGFKFLAATATGFTGSGTEFRKSIFRECGGAGLTVFQGTGVALGLQATNVNVYDCQFYLNTDDDINDDAAGGTQTYYSQWHVHGCHFMTRNKATYLDMNGGSGTTELLVSGNYFAEDVALDATKIQLPTGGVFTGNYDAVGVVNGSTF